MRTMALMLAALTLTACVRTRTDPATGSIDVDVESPAQQGEEWEGTIRGMNMYTSLAGTAKARVVGGVVQRVHLGEPRQEDEREAERERAQRRGDLRRDRDACRLRNRGHHGLPSSIGCPCGVRCAASSHSWRRSSSAGAATRPLAATMRSSAVSQWR